MAKKPSPPPAAPDYTQIANQQASLDRQAAQQQTRANRPNQTNPWGSVQWTEGPDGQWTQDVRLNQQDQALLDQSRTARSGLMGRATTAMGQEFNPELTDFATVDPSRGEFGYVKEVQDAIMGGLQPGLDRMRDRDLTRLSAMGNVGNTRLSQRTNEDISFRENDAERKALLSAVDVSGNLVDRQRGIAGDRNQVRAQQFAEALRRRQMPLQEYAQFQQIEQGGRPDFESFQTGTPFQAADVSGAARDQYSAEIARNNAINAGRASRNRGLMGLAATGVGGFLGAGTPLGVLGGAQIGSRIGGALG